MPDETVKCASVLESVLPRESNSKETDDSILSIIGYPAFAVSNNQLVVDTLETLLDKLGGKYGMATRHLERTLIGCIMNHGS